MKGCLILPARIRKWKIYINSHGEGGGGGGSPGEGGE